MKGLPWFKLPTVHDDPRMIVLTDRAHRTMVDLLSVANAYATGPRMSYKLALAAGLKRMAEGVRQLEEAGAVKHNGDVLEIIWFKEYIVGAERIEAQRARWRKDKKASGQDSFLDAEETSTGRGEDAELTSSAHLGDAGDATKAPHIDESADIFRAGIRKDSDALEVRGESLDNPTGLQDVLGAARKEAKDVGLTLEKAWYTRLGKKAKELLEAGADAEMLRGAAKVVVNKGRSPSHLGFVLQDMQRAKGGVRRGRSDGTSFW